MVDYIVLGHADALNYTESNTVLSVVLAAPDFVGINISITAARSSMMSMPGLNLYQVTMKQASCSRQILFSVWVMFE